MNKNYLSGIIKSWLLLLAVFFSITSIAQVQPPNQKITKKIHSNGSALYCGGYLLSLPLNYAANPTKKYPLLIFNHGAGERGIGDSAALAKIESGDGTSGTIPNLIKNGNFPASFTVDNEDFSFIVVCPQFIYNSGDVHRQIIEAMIDTCKNLYRVDTSRIYITGLSMGGGYANGYIGNAYSYTPVRETNKLAAALLICPSSIIPNLNPSMSTYANVIRTSNLPFWIISNFGDTKTPRNNLKLYVDTLNLDTIPGKLNPAAKLTIMDSSAGDVHNAWTKAYNPSNTWNGLNVYQWMLQYTNKKLTANAGLDQAITLPWNSTITLNGSKSTARQGRITAWLWTKISGPTAGTITNSNNSITTVTGIDTGTYRFELKITHTDGTTARDTIKLSTQTSKKITKYIYKLGSDTIIGGYLESLPVDYYENPTKKYPLLVFGHRLEEIGNGSQSALTKLDTTTGIPRLIHKGQFPSVVTYNNKQYSFIVVSPQLSSIGGSGKTTALNAFIDSCKKLYRVDTTRIYLTGIRVGGLYMNELAAGIDTNIAKKIAAVVPVSPTNISPIAIPSFSFKGNIIGATDLPLWITSNSGDATQSNVPLYIDTINMFNPSPLAKQTIFSASGTDSWTTTYNPANKFWSDSVNFYQWLLKYTRTQTSPRKIQIATDKTTIPEDATILDAVLNPNPVHSQVTVWLTGKSKGKASVALYSLSGQQLAQQQFIKNANEKTSRTFNVARFTSGTYVVQVIVDGKYKRTLQFIKY